MNCSNRMCMHRVVFPSVTGNWGTTHLYCVGFLRPNLIIAETFWKAAECFQYASYAIESVCASPPRDKPQHVLVLTSIRWSNHMWLTHQWSRINDCHLWLASIFCGAIDGSWVVMSSLKTRPTITVWTRDRPHTLLFIATYMLHKRVSICLLICLLLGNKSTRHTPQLSVCKVMPIFPSSLASSSLEKHLTFKYTFLNTTE